MTRKHIVATIACAILFCAIGLNAADDQQHEGTLYPGESYTFKGVTFTWETPKDIQPPEEGKTPIGQLKVKGAKASFSIPAPLLLYLSRSDRSNPNNTKPAIYHSASQAYLDDVFIYVTGGGSKWGVAPSWDSSANISRANRHLTPDRIKQSAWAIHIIARSSSTSGGSR